MPASKPYEELSETTKRVYDLLQKADLNPRVRMALRMYAFGAVSTLTEAAEVCGVSLAYLSMKKNSPAGQQYMNKVQQILDDKTASTSQIISQLGRRAIEVIGEQMEDPSDPKLRLRAAIDLADRAPETSKVQKIQMESFTLAGRDAQAIAAALVAGKSVNERFANLAEGDFDKVSDTKLLPESTDATWSTSDTQHPQRTDEVK